MESLDTMHKIKKSKWHVTEIYRLWSEIRKHTLRMQDACYAYTVTDHIPCRLSAKGHKEQIDRLRGKLYRALKFCPKEFPRGYWSLPKPVPEEEIWPVSWGLMCNSMMLAGKDSWNCYPY